MIPGIWESGARLSMFNRFRPEKLETKISSCHTIGYSKTRFLTRTMLQSYP
jgi:hypothetical protein